MFIKKMVYKIFNQSSEDRLKMITEGEIKSTFMLMALPGIITLIIQSISPIIDGLLIFNFDSSTSGAAISYVTSLQNIVILGISGMASAGSAVVGKFNGMGNFNKAKSVAGQLLFLTVSIGTLFIPIISFICFLVTFNNGNVELTEKILAYNSIVIFSLPFICLQSAYNGIQNVFGHPEKALIRILLFVPIKITFSFIFLVVLNLGIYGAAFSNIFTYMTVSIFIIYDLFVKESRERFILSDFKLFKGDILDIYRKAWPAVIQNSTKSLSFFLIRVELSKYSSDPTLVNALSVNSIAGDINQVYMCLISCYDAAVVSFVSVNIGAKNIDRAKKAAYLPLKISLATSTILTFVSFVIAPFIVSFYTKDFALAEAAIKASRIYSVGLISYSLMFVEMPTFTGLGLTKISLIIQVTRIWVIRILVMYLLYWIFPEIGFYAVFWSLTIANLCGGIMSHVFFVKIKWKSFIYNK